jgi:DNA polymerase bacteriophage-type
MPIGSPASSNIANKMSRLSEKFTTGSVMLSLSEQALYQLNDRINNRGAHIDRALVKAAIKIAEAAAPEINEEIKLLTDGIEIGQIKKLLQWAQAQGYPAKSLAQEIIEQELEKGNLSPKLEKVLRLRLEGAQAVVNKLEKMLLCCAAEDDRIRGMYVYHGARTGRFAGQIVQLQNLKRPIIEDLDAAIAVVSTGDLAQVKELYLKPLEVLGDLTRSMITPAPGRVFYGGDFSGIEARMLVWAAGEVDALEAYRRFDRTHNPEDEAYRLAASAIFGVLPDQVTKDQRLVGKVCVLAFGFQGAIPAFRKFEAAYGLDPDRFTDDEVLHFLKAWREAHPRVCQFWEDINDAAVKAVRYRGKVVRCGFVAFKCVGAFLWMKLPSGRKLAYPYPKLNGSAVVYMDGGKKQFRETRNGQGAYGGIWTENAISGMARDLFVEAMHRVENAGFPIVLHTHDEIVCEVPEGFSNLDEFKQLMMPLPSWASDLPIAVEAWSGQRYAK